MANLGTGAVTETRIAEIMGLVRSWKWQRDSRAVARHARKWSLSEDYVRDLANEAKRRVYAEVTDPTAVSGNVATAMSAIVAEGMAHEGKGKAQMRRLAVDAGKALAQIVGAMAPQRHEVVATAATPAKVSAAMKEAFGPVGPDAPDAESSSEP